MTLWNRIRGPLEVLLWLGVLGFATYRFGPQVGAALGFGERNTALPGDARTTPIPTLDGTLLTLKELEGQVVLVNVWATWCPPCVVEMPSFQKINDDYGGEGFVILGLARDEDPTRVRAFLKQKGITYPVAMAAGLELGEITGGNVLPTSYLLGRDGSVKHRVEGLFAGPALRMAVKKLLEAPPTRP